MKKVKKAAGCRFFHKNTGKTGEKRLGIAE